MSIENEVRAQPSHGIATLESPPDYFGRLFGIVR